MNLKFPVFLGEEILELASKLGVEAMDIEEKFIKGGGAGGQKINKTASCVQLKHVPSGTEVKCQRYREREKNRQAAYVLLLGKMEDQVMGANSKRAKLQYKIHKQKQKRSKRVRLKMLEEKRKRSAVKEGRNSVDTHKHT